MARQRNVWDTDRIPHLWAHQTQSSARNARNNLYFTGDTIYSYGAHFPLARIAKHKGKQFVFFTSHGWSSTTNMHKSITRQACQHLPTFVVDSPADSISSAWTWIKAQAKKLREQFDQSKSRPQRLSRFAKLHNYVHTVRQFAEFFGYVAPQFLPENWEPLSTEYQDYRNKLEERRTQANATRSERWRKEREEAQRIAALDSAERIELWRNGGNVATWHLHNLPTMLRVNGDEIETSQGVSFPVEHALRCLSFVEGILARGGEFKANGHTIKLGHYAIDSIDAQGTIRAGCHEITKEEVLLLIEALKAMPSAV